MTRLWSPLDFVLEAISLLPDQSFSFDRYRVQKIGENLEDVCSKNLVGTVRAYGNVYL